MAQALEVQVGDVVLAALFFEGLSHSSQPQSVEFFNIVIL
jgi:hypothetical protein